MATTQQQNNVEAREERFFPVALRGNEHLIQQALEHALGVKLQMWSAGLWSGRKDVESDAWFDIMVRALPVQGGTSVEVIIKPRWTQSWGFLWGSMVAIGCLTLFPLLWAIPYASRRSERVRRHKLVNMHRIWTELGEAIGAPVRADGYRGKPRRIYEPAEMAPAPQPEQVWGQPEGIAQSEEEALAFEQNRQEALRR